jgi:hypothetical protein
MGGSFTFMTTNPTQQQLIAYKLRIVSHLADSLSLATDSAAIRKGLDLISETVFQAALEVRNLSEPEPEGYTLEEVLERLDARRPAHSLGRS